MNKTYEMNGKRYELTTNYKDGFDLTAVEEKITDFFDLYDYIVGDWAYGKLRLKGFCKKQNKIFKKVNDYRAMEQYIKEDCAHECRHFILEKIKEEPITNKS